MNLAQHLAISSGKPVAEIVMDALREYAQSHEIAAYADPSDQEIADIIQRCASLPDLDARTPEEILGYDNNGLPS